jgi:hypothetical protein
VSLFEDEDQYPKKIQKKKEKKRKDGKEIDLQPSLSALSGNLVGWSKPSFKHFNIDDTMVCPRGRSQDDPLYSYL